MGWPKIDPAILALLLDGAEEAALWAVHKIFGESSSDKAKKTAKALARKSLEAMIKGMHDELEQQVAVHNLAHQFIELGNLAEHMMDEINQAERHPSLPNLFEGARVHVMHVWRKPDDNDERKDSEICRRCGRPRATAEDAPCVGSTVDPEPVPSPMLGPVPEPVKTVFILNGVYTTVPDARLTYEQLVELAGKTGTPTIVYSDSTQSGDLLPGQTLVVTTNMVVSVMHTDNV